MNKYLKNLEKIEFVVTYACTGRCKHCSEGDHKSCGVHMDPAVAADAVCLAIEATPDEHWYGVCFEKIIPELTNLLK